MTACIPNHARRWHRPHICGPVHPDLALSNHHRHNACPTISSVVEQRQECRNSSLLRGRWSSGQSRVYNLEQPASYTLLERFVPNQSVSSHLAPYHSTAQVVTHVPCPGPSREIHPPLMPCPWVELTCSIALLVEHATIYSVVYRTPGQPLECRSLSCKQDFIHSLPILLLSFCCARLVLPFLHSSTLSVDLTTPRLACGGHPFPTLTQQLSRQANDHSFNKGSFVLLTDTLFQQLAFTKSSR